MPAAKLDVQLAERMLRGGATQAEVIAEHARRNITVRQSTISTAIKDGRIKYSTNRGLTRMGVPWKLKPEHRYLSPARMLRIQARYDQGLPLSETLEKQRERWIAGLMLDNTVIHYDPETPEGFWRFPRREGIDTWYVREPWIDDDGNPIPRPA